MLMLMIHNLNIVFVLKNFMLRNAKYIVNEELREISRLSEQHNLKLNPNKSAVVVFGGARAKGVEVYLCRLEV